MSIGMVKYMGNPQLTEAKGEPVSDSKNPNWRWAEMWRVLNVYKTLLWIADTKAGNHGYVGAVTEYLNGLDKNDLSEALFPEEVKKLLRENEDKIVNQPKKRKALPWVGHPSHQGPIAQFEGIQITSGKDMKFGQECPVGPLSIEASFILATQLAGINWQTLNSHISQNAKLNGVYWMNAIIPHDRQDSHIVERRIISEQKDISRNFGYLSRRATSFDSNRDPVTGSPDAGFLLLVSTMNHDYTVTHRFRLISFSLTLIRISTAKMTQKIFLFSLFIVRCLIS
jgi:hypothetical protein